MPLKGGRLLGRSYYILLEFSNIFNASYWFIQVHKIKCRLIQCQCRGKRKLMKIWLSPSFLLNTLYIKIIVRVSCHFQTAVKLYKLKKLYWDREPHVHSSHTHFSILWFQNLGRVPRQGEHGRVSGPQIIGRISGLKISWESRRRAFQVVTDSSASPR